MNVWDFAGQIHYHSMHQTFFRPNCLYVLVLDLQTDDSGLRISTEENMLLGAQKWLNSIVSCTGPDIGLVIVGTHGDSTEEADVRLDSLLSLLEGLVADVEADRVLRSATTAIVDNKNRTGIDQLKKLLLDQANCVLQRLKDVPLRWLRLLDLLDELLPEPNSFCIPYGLIETKAKSIGILESEELTEALQFFDRIGDIIYIDDDGLKEWVFPQPLLLLNAMKMLVSDAEPAELLKEEKVNLQKYGLLSNDALSRLWSEHSCSNQKLLRSVLASTGLILNFGTAIVIPSRLKEHVDVPPLDNEIELAVTTRVSSHLPPNIFAYVIAKFHGLHGDEEQDLGLISESCACLRLREESLSLSLGGSNKLKWWRGRSHTNIRSHTNYRLLIVEQKLHHQITIVVRASAQSSNVLSENSVADVATQLTISLHRLLHERFRWMSLNSFIEFASGSRWTILQTTPERLGIILKAHHVNTFGSRLSLIDAVCKSSKTTQPQRTDEYRLPKPVCLIDDVEALIAMKLPHDMPIQEDQIRRLIETEKALVKWLAQLSTLEVTTSYKPDKADIAWINRISRFYHKLVPCLKRYYSCHGESPQLYTVFVSHAGEDKDDYASPLQRYLNQNKIKTFLDRANLRTGADPDYEMLHAAITCRYMWCVLSVDFAKKWYPMRELLIGYTRHVQEPRGDFCLIMDCFEKKRVRGQWMDRIREEIQSLRIYNRDGESVQFPVRRPAIMHEDFHERFCKIASLPLGNGEALVIHQHDHA